MDNTQQTPTNNSHVIDNGDAVIGLSIGTFIVSAFALFSLSNTHISYLFLWLMFTGLMTCIGYGIIPNLVKPTFKATFATSKRRCLFGLLALLPAITAQLGASMMTGDTEVKITQLAGVELGSQFVPDDSWQSINDVTHSHIVKRVNEYSYVKPDETRPESMVYVALVDGMVYRVSLYFTGDIELDHGERRDQFDELLTAKYGDTPAAEYRFGWTDGENVIAYDSYAIHAFIPDIDKTMKARAVQNDHKRIEQAMNTYIGSPSR